MSIYQFHAQLEGFKPKMWRRFLVNDDITVAQLGYIVLCIFRMEGRHLFELKKPEIKPYKRNGIVHGINKARPEIYYNVTPPDEDLFNSLEAFFGNSDFENLDAKEELMSNAVSLEEKDNILILSYDFGDDWNIKIKLEKILDESEVKEEQIPCVLRGKGYGIIEDCGGVYGLSQIAEAIELQAGEAYEQYCELIDLDEIDLEDLDKDELNILLPVVPSLLEEMYEKSDEFC